MGDAGGLSRSEHQVDRTWWQASDGWYYPPQAHPQYAQLVQEAQVAARADLAVDAPAPPSRRTRTTTWSATDRFTVVRIVVFGFIAFGGIGAVFAAFRSSDVTIPFSSAPSFMEASLAASVQPLIERRSLGLVVDAASPVGLDDGRPLFVDDLVDPTSGWNTQQYRGGASVGYAGGGYDMSVANGAIRWEYAPTDDTARQVTVGATASVSAAPDAAEAAGSVGVVCGNGLADYTLVRFAVAADGRWTLTVHRKDRDAVRLDDGRTDAPGADGVRVTLMCASIGGGRQRFSGFVGDQQVADEVTMSSYAERWYGGVSASGPGTGHFTEFEIRNLGR